MVEQAKQVSPGAAMKWGAALVGAVWVKLGAVMQALLWLMALDYASGFAAAAATGMLCSSKGWRGLAKKSLMLMLVAGVHVADQNLGLNLGFKMDGMDVEFRAETALALGLCLNELISLVENCARAGLPIPAPIVGRLLKLKQLWGSATQAQLAELAAPVEDAPKT
jgi:toxin secretion/phage lysis holin